MRLVGEVAPLADDIVSQLRAELTDLLPGCAVQHVGATSLSQGHTKGDVDIAVSVTATDFGPSVTALRSRYEIAQPENWTNTYASFSASDRELPTGIQLAVAGSPDDFLVPLRDLLRARPDLLASYEACKRRAAPLGADDYWRAKDAFLRAILAEYLPWARPAHR